MKALTMDIVSAFIFLAAALVCCRERFGVFFLFEHVSFCQISFLFVLFSNELLQQFLR